MPLIKSRKLRIQLRKIFWVMVGWLIFANLQFLYEYMVLIHFNCTPANYHFETFWVATQITGVVAGLLGGLLLTTLFHKWLREKAYWLALIHILISYIGISLVVVFFTSAYINSQELQLSIFNWQVLMEVRNYMFSLDFFRTTTIWLFVVLITMIIFLVNDKYGPGVFGSFLLGRYFHPKREERIFMFLDIKSSTTIAEKLGEEKYFELVRDFYAHATDGIIYSKGEIYQYVGDEIVVSWRMENGLEKANCIQCYFDIREAILNKRSYYEEKYGVYPEFKAGFHYGHVMAGEVGLVKRDLAFSGDVLNTTARIQSKCNELGVKILLSKYLLDKLALPPHSFQPEKIGEIALRGKQQKVVLYTLE